MSKHWDDLPRWLRWTIAGLAALAVVVLVAWVLFVPVADSLARHDVGPVTGRGRASRLQIARDASRLQTARDAARGRLLTLGAGVLAAGALIFTASNYRLARRTHELTERGQVTDRYTKAIDQLGSDNLDVRIGGIYALERIARDSRPDHPTVMEVLFAFIRGRSPKDRTPPKDRAGRDVQAAVTVIGGRTTEYDRQEEWYVNLRFANLKQAHLEHAHLNGADLYGAHLEGAWLTDAHLHGANLYGAHLNGAQLHGANLTDAHLEGAHLQGAYLHDANLTGAHWPTAAEPPQGWEPDPADPHRLKRVGGKAPESPAS